MEPLTEALEIVESMMIHRDRSGIGRLYVLLCVVQERYFVGVEEDDLAELAELAEDAPFPAA